MKCISLTLLTLMTIVSTLHSQPSGTIVAFSGTNIPKGWDICDGKEVNQSSERYKRLFEVIKTTWGSTTPTTFKLPDLREKFLLGVSSIGEVSQSGGAKSHDHPSLTSEESKGGKTDGYRVPDGNDHRAPISTGALHFHVIPKVEHMPPYAKVVYIIKL